MLNLKLKEIISSESVLFLIHMQNEARKDPLSKQAIEYLEASKNELKANGIML